MTFKVLNICYVLQKNISVCVCVCVHTLGALFSFYSGLLCVCILLGVFCAIIRRGRERENTVLFIYTAVNSDAACFRFAFSVKHSGFQANNTLPPLSRDPSGGLSDPLLPYPSCWQACPLLEFGSGECGTLHTQHANKSIC